MNKRILELKEQCYISVADQDDDDRSISPAGIHGGDDDNAGLAGEWRYLRR